MMIQNGMKINLNIYYSAVCNMKCDYCCMPAEDNDPIKNSEIRSKIISGEFQNIIISNNWKKEIQKRLVDYDEYDTSILELVTLGIWGMEPTINQDLWEQFIIPILNKYDTIKGIFLSTNGMIFDYDSWALPLLNYCNQHQRKIKLWVQFSIDGPDYSQKAVNNLLNCCRRYETNEYFRIKLSTKATLNKETLYQDIDKWYSYMAGLYDSCNRLAKQGCDVRLVGSEPTFERPGNWTQEDGIQWAKWHIKIPTNIKFECPAGITSFTINSDSRLYSCQLCNQLVPELSDSLFNFTIIDNLYSELLEQNQIQPINQTILLNAISTMFCKAQERIAFDKIMPTGYQKIINYDMLEDIQKYINQNVIQGCTLKSYILMLANGALQQQEEEE